MVNMAIAYKEEALPSVATFGFDITRWAGVNTVKGSQYDYEMTDCKNMSSHNFPYASPRKPREKLIDEVGIKRIYKVEDGKVYFIDNEDCLCYVENGVKGYIENIKMPECLCTNNYDKNTVFYPNMQYIDENKSLINIADEFKFGATEDYYDENTIAGLYMLSSYSELIPIVNSDVRKFKLRALMSNDESKEDSEFVFPFTGYGIEIKIGYSIFDEFSNLKKSVTTYIGETLVRDNIYNFTFPDDLILEVGDYIRIEIFAQSGYNPLENGFTNSNLNYIKNAIWTLECADNTPSLFLNALDYGVVYNNRIVGVHKNEIHASALGDFTNFTEYADEAGNPSATGAYATDVGSAGDFTGICAYNNVLLLFKKNIVYEMYGSMPYTISELCSTGCIDNDSICEIDGVLYWASPKGIVRYSGGVPSVISTNIEIKTDGTCKAGTDGRKYYVYDGNRIYVYDTYYRMWHIEDEKSVGMFYNNINNLYMVCDDGIYKVDSGEENVEWEFTTKDYTFYSKERKNLSKLWIRADMKHNTKLEIYVRQNGGEWTRVATKTAERDEMFDFKLRVKKCDSYTLKFKGKGDVRILDIHGKVTVGTSKHRGGDSLNVYRR